MEPNVQTLMDTGVKAPTHEKARRDLAEAFWNICRLYGFNQEQQAALLGIKYNRAGLLKLRESVDIPDDHDKFYRVGLLLGIHKNLRILYPQNRDVVYKWMSMPLSIPFNGDTAINYVTKEPSESLVRLASVRRYLDNLRVAGL